METPQTAPTPTTLKEILAIEDIERKIRYLKRGRRTPMPATERNRRDWDPRKHDIMDESKYKKIRVLTEMERIVTDTDELGRVTQRTIPARYEQKEPNRIALPIEQDIVNIQTSFTVGTEPTLDCTPNGEDEQELLTAVKQTFKRNKLAYQNRAIVRSWLREQEVAEYWYVVKDESFWRKIERRIGHSFSVLPQYRLVSQVWSPFHGDKIYPFYDEDGNYLACSREYRVKDLDDNERTCFMTATETEVYVWEQGKDGHWGLTKNFAHNLGGVPVMYAYRREAYTSKVRKLRERLEKCLSGYANCIDYHFFPKLLLFGELDKVMGDPSEQVLQIANMTGEGADARYLTWQQSSDPIKTEIETYFNQIYSLTNTPRISFDQLQGIGSALSGTAFRYFFMSAHMAVKNHGETLGEFFQRRVNFIVKALGLISVYYKEASSTIDVSTEIVPFIIDSTDDRVSTAVQAVSGGVWSTEHGVAYCSDYGETRDEVERIVAERAASQSGENAAGEGE